MELGTIKIKSISTLGRFTSVETLLGSRRIKHNFTFLGDKFIRIDGISAKEGMPIANLIAKAVWEMIKTVPSSTS